MLKVNLVLKFIFLGLLVKFGNVSYASDAGDAARDVASRLPLTTSCSGAGAGAESKDSRRPSTDDGRWRLRWCGAKRQ